MSKVKSVLEGYGFTSLGREQNIKRITELSDSHLYDLILALFQVLDGGDYKNKSLFEFETGRTISGGAIPCSDFDCRKKQLKKTLDFAVLYADKTSLKSPMDGHFNNLMENSFIQLDELLFDIESLITMEPLIEKGIISFFSEYSCLCADCYQQNKIKENAIRELILNNELKINELVKYGIQFELSYQKDHYYIRILKNLKYGFEHEMHILIKDSTFLNNAFRRVELENVKNGRKYSLTKQQRDFVFDNYIVPVYVTPILNDIFYSKLFFEGTSKTYLSNRSIDEEIINMLSTSARKISNISDEQILDKVDYAFPYIEDSDYKKLISLRESELASFKIFRDEFSKDIKEFDMTKESYEDFQRDIIQPKINRINTSIEKNKKYISHQRLKNIGSNIVFPLITFSVGKYYGLDTIANIGLSGAIPLSNHIGKILEKPKSFEVKDEDYYFLWRVQESFSK
ncbi:hypothetical protein [Brochothrix thermosphacta]|uniref:hypothetical protein n=1 Tax=Brochothrix thermosphacta TaxID=2756 RepID=UPI000D7A5361|nr:hypothetical protein [Brochothrix thermosphacta]SPN74784.1 hypothetical protein BTEBP_120073 [Brochothrix thermosphacta]